jgi:membrane-bound lytic murein transglycosylase MltF
MRRTTPAPRESGSCGAKRFVGVNPNVWFDNVEQIVSERIGHETVSYVSNIYKYYVAYRLVVEEDERRAAARSRIRSRGSH